MIVAEVDFFGQLGDERIRLVRERLDDFSPVMRRLAAYLRGANKAHFASSRGAQLSGVSFDGLPWDKVSATYHTKKTRAGFPNWLMRRTGKLAKSLHVKRAQHHVEEITPNSVEVGSSDPVIGFHWPGQRKDGKSRQAVFLTDSDISDVRDLVTDELKAFWLGAEGVARLHAAYAAKKASES